jgi:hypothetical protein
MYDTISPDHRPTDLGPNDAGFAFTATDPLASDTGRTFIWSGTEWVETSQVLYGTHANRPLTADAPARCIYVEADRGPLYQNQLGQWVYIAGTMWGTISPDQRPTDLGMFDAGFTFRTNVAPARQFIWSGTAWVEIAPVMYGTHAARPASSVAPANALYVEGDRGPMFQNQLGQWVYIAGTMWGTISPDQRPTDLGIFDAGFDFRTNVAPAREFIWSGSAWVEVTPQTNAVQIAYASAGVTLTTSNQPIPGTTLTLPLAGQYLVQGTFYFNLTSGDTQVYVIGSIPGGSGGAVLFAPTMTAGQALQITVSQQWIVPAAAGGTVNLQAYKTGGSGTSTVEPGYTSISALWVSP